MKKNIQIIKRFAKSDTKCSGDYHSVELIIEDDIAASYGDHYHDKGDDKIAGFLDALVYIFPDDEFEVVRINKNDIDFDDE